MITMKSDSWFSFMEKEHKRGLPVIAGVTVAQLFALRWIIDLYNFFVFPATYW